MRYVFAALATVLFLFGQVAHAHAATAIAVVDSRRVIAESNEAKKLMSDIEKMKKEMQDKLQGIEKKLTDKKEELDRKQTVLSESQFLDEQSKLKSEVRDFRSKGQSMEEELNKEFMLRRREIIRILQQVVTELAKERGYDVVLDAGQLLYANDSVDVTDEVMKRVNKHFDTAK